jgi:site-specific recombinase XerD
MHRSLLMGDGRRRSVVTFPAYRLGMRPANYGKKYPAEVLSTVEVEQLLAVMPRRGYTGPRNRAMVVLMWRSGLRIAEVIALNPRDVDLVNGTISILHGKGDRMRVVGLDAGTAAVIEVWLAKRAELGIGRGHPLFCVTGSPTRGKHLSSAYFREMLKLYAEKADLERRVHPHGLRHTFAAQLAREGVPVHVIRKALGHASLATTERYIDHLAPLEVIDTVKRREWADEPTHQAPPSGV